MSKPTKTQSISRRTAITYTSLLIGSIACSRDPYKRPSARLNLGHIKSLAFSQVHLRDQSVMVFRDEEGFRALSTRCSYDSCDLSYHDRTETPYLICPCCKSIYSLDGIPTSRSTATTPLNFLDLYYKDNHLYAEASSVRPVSWRFKSEEIDEYFRAHGLKIKPQSISDGVHVPKVVLGGGDSSPGTMFLDEDPDERDDRKMIR